MKKIKCNKLSIVRKMMKKQMRKYRVPLDHLNYPSRPHPCLPDHDYELVNEDFDRLTQTEEPERDLGK